ncbi:Lrp/AsnC family transcriptional regulator [Novispirillum itersonii]|uniref:Lrp/AsnC family transcriptional regulator n=1 Tax=Novispirillum itersonii TaxID=189 RepID=UPI00037B0029|nr:Lrp/AsnC family transcriptional regulator [Novispirillum itersonii]
MPLDRLDRKILSILQLDAGLTNAALAEKVGTSPSSCLRRVQRLRDSGVLRHTVALVDPAAAGRSLTALVEVFLDHHGVPQRQDFVRRLVQEPAVAQAWAVTGEPDVMLMMHLRDMQEYQVVCDRLFGHDANVVRFRSLFVMETYKAETAVSFSEDS